LSQDDYINLPNKSFQGKPLQYWFQKTKTLVILNLWPVPDATQVVNVLVVTAHRQIMDVGTYLNDVEVPQNWLNACISGLACRIAREIEEIDEKVIPRLDADFTLASSLAWGQERDNSPMMLAADISMYTV
jgi:hypothetical protein